MPSRGALQVVPCCTTSRRTGCGDVPVGTNGNLDGRQQTNIFVVGLPAIVLNKPMQIVTLGCSHHDIPSCLGHQKALDQSFQADH